MANKFVTKPGEHGMLYLYSVKYTDKSDPCCPEFKQRLFAYNIEHALDRFYGTEDAEGWTAISVTRVLQGIVQLHAIEHEVE